MKDRIDLAKYFNELNFRTGAEIGVADARYSELLLQNINNLRLYSVDPYFPYEGNWRSKDYQETAYKQAKERLSKYSKSVLMRMTGVQASLEIPDNSLDFVFIDADHAFDGVMVDIILWSKKVRSGGVVAGHDFYPLKAGGVIPAVSAYIQAHQIELNLIPRATDCHKDDRVPCWWFVKK